MNFPFNRWLLGEKVLNDLDRVKEVFKVEQFLSKITDQSLKTLVLDRHPQSMVEAAKMADHFIATHRKCALNTDV